MNTNKQLAFIMRWAFLGLFLCLLTGCSDSGHYSRGYVISRSEDWTEEAESVMRVEEDP